MKKKQHILQKSFHINLFIEIPLFLFIVIVVILPSILIDRKLVIPLKPKILGDIFPFLFKIFLSATFEELIYRVYLPFQMKRFILTQDKIPKEKENYVFILISNTLFSLAHSYLGIWNICFAFVVGLFFSFIYENLKKNAYIAFFTISLIHFFYNGIIFYIFYI